MATAESILYIETDIPRGMTHADYRRRRATRTTLRRRPRIRLRRRTLARS
jgi:hypothetical protein